MDQKQERQLSNGEVTICTPVVAAVRCAPVADDVAESRNYWLAFAQQDLGSIIYFSIYCKDKDENRLVGQIFLHDYDQEQKESLIGYHLFQPQDRGQGIGTAALRLLLQYVLAKTSIQRLVIITDENNSASRRVAEKCGFVYTGPAGEGLPLIRYKWYRVQ
jgi:RimJ/RimL family protein N-acetyltransferase